ncbi:hypothetical protein HAHE_25390 [Haloferula helveola]|uniref:Fibronectin type-III domain-containing protein n=1 Tax=Haloferula helveola TaxID=490095 RepID=A0ABN6H4P9_9BACT|nr:hypothetical protein HAHE_25390 [Haloferula helveola]
MRLRFLNFLFVPLLATSLCLSAQAGERDLKIILLLGQSNMEGQAFTFADPSLNAPSLEFLLSGTPAATTYLGNMPYEFGDSLSPSWLDPRTDAWCVHYDSTSSTLKNVLPTSDPADLVNGIQPLSPGFGVSTGNGSMFGAELSMGHRLADSVAAPLFLFKSDKGGTTLGHDWRPPTAVAARGGTVGVNYSNTITRFLEFLDDLDTDLADNGVLDAYNGAPGYEVCAVFWFQGFNEQFNSGPYTAAQLQAEYADNLKDLIYSIRAADPRIPDRLPIIIGESSDQNATLNAARISAVADLNSEIPDSAAYFDTDDMIGEDWGNNDAGEPFTSGGGYHYHARAENFLEIGWKAAEAVIENGYIAQAPTFLDSRVASGKTYTGFIIGVTGIEATIDDFTVTIDSTAAGSPSDGLFQSGDVITSVNGVLLQDDEDPRIPLGTQIGAAEAFDGELDFGILRGAIPMNVTITIPVLGAYTETWPLSCPKSDAIVDSVAQEISNSAIMNGIELEAMLAGLFLLSTGDDQYLDEAKSIADNVVAGGLSDSCWAIGYQLVFLCEYYLRTGDATVLPRIQELCDHADTGDVEGMYSHRLGPSSGYVQGGTLNQAGNIVVLGMTLARECGVNVPVDTWKKSIDFLYRYAGHGPVPYGNHRAEFDPNSNGKDGSVACLWSLLDGDDFVSAAEYTGLAVAESYTFLEVGHTGGGFNVIWRALGAMHTSAAYEDRHRNMLDRLTWYYDLCRRHDGTFRIPTTIGGHWYTGGGYGMGAAMVYTASRKTLRITGAAQTAHSVPYPAHTATWGNERDREFLADAPPAAYGGEDQRIDAIWRKLYNPDELPASYFGRLLYHSNSQVRQRAATTLSQRADAASIAELKATLQDPDPRPRRAALEGIVGYEGWARPMSKTSLSPQTVSEEFLPLIKAVIDDPDSSLWEIDGALWALSKAEPEDVRDNLDFILPYLTHDDWWLREAAFWAMTGLRDTMSGEEFLRLTEVYANEAHVYPKGSYQAGFALILETKDPADWGEHYVKGLQTIGRDLHEPKVLDGYTNPEAQSVVRALMVYDEFDKDDLPLDIADDIAQYFAKWETNDAGISGNEIKANPSYHRGFYGWANTMGADGAFIIHPMKRMAEDIAAAIAGGDNSPELQNYYDELINSIALHEATYGVVTPYPGQTPNASSATASIIGGLGTKAELSLDGSLSSDPEGVLYDYVWEANGELVARGAVTTGFAEISDLGQLTLRVTDDQAHQHEIAVAVAQDDPALTYGLAGYWPMDMTRGSEVRDQSPYANHGAFSEGAPVWVAGKFGNALEISQARDDRALIPHLDAYNANHAYSLSLWFHSVEGDDKLDQFAKGEGLVAINGTGSAATVDAFGTPWTSANLGFSMGDATWHHIVLTFDKDASPAKHLYVDGALVATGDSDGVSDPALNTDPISFGSSDDAEKSSALFDDVAIWNRVITTTEIAYLHNGGAGNIVTDWSTPPTRPTGLAAVEGDDQVSLSWDADTTTLDFGGYRVYRSETSGGPYAVVSGDLTSTSFTDTTAINYTTYHYVVRTINTRGNESHNSREVEATPFIPLKDVLAVGLQGYWPMDSVGGTAIIDVTAQENHGSFLQGSPDWVPGKFGNALDVVSERQDWAQIPHLANYNTTGSYSISLWFYPVNCYRDANVFSKGLNKAAIGFTNQDARWSHLGSPWTSSSLGFTHNAESWQHIVMIYDPAATPAKKVYCNGVLVASDDTDGLGSDTALNTDPIAFSSNSTAYATTARYDDVAIWNRALTTDEIGYLYNTGEGNTLSDLNNPPATPTGLVATPTTEAVVLTWDESTDGDTASYEILRSLVSGGPYESLGTTTATSYVDSGLTNGVTYYYVLRALDVVGEVSASTAEVFAIPADDTTAPAAPTGLASSNGYRRVYLDWDDSPETDFDSYNVYRSDDVGGPFALLGGVGADSSFTDENLANGATYYYRITALDIAGNESAPAAISGEPFANQDVATGLVGYWPLDAAIGTVAEDMTANENDGNVVTGSPDWVLGKFGNALRFVEAEQESVFIDNLAAYRETGAFTLAFWINQVAGSGNRPLESAGILMNNHKMTIGDAWDNTELGFGDDNTWHHVACVFDVANPETGKKLYVDGMLIAENVALPADSLLSGSSWIRMGIDHSAYRWGGLLDDLAMWNRALSLDEIQSLVLYNGGTGRTIQEQPQTPPIADSQSVSTDEDIALPITLTGGDGQGDLLTYIIVDDVSDGVLSGTAPNLTYTPNPNSHGADQFTFKINDGQDDSNIATVSITVNSLNDPPVADGQDVETDEDVALPITLTASDADLDVLSFTIHTDPANGSLSGTAPDLTYTPDPDFHGADSFTFLVNDGLVDSAVATIDITVNSVNDPPVAEPLTLYLLQDSNIAVQLFGSDKDQDPLTFAIETDPQHGTLSGTGAELTYTPTPGYSGPDSFTYFANDGTEDGAPVLVEITVYALADTKDLLAQGLVGYWPMDNTSGTELTDEGPLGNHGSFIEGTPAWIPGKFGNAIDLKGYRDDRVEIPHIDEFNQTGSYSISLWVYTIDCYRDISFFNKGPNFVALGASNNDIKWQKFGVPWTSTDLNFNGNDNSWRHVVAVYDPSATPAKQIYVDGTLVASGDVDTTDPSQVLNDSPINFNHSADHYKADVRFDDTAYWDRPLTTAEIGFLYNSGTGNTVSDSNATPSAPTTVVATATTGTVLLSWEVTDPDITSCEVYRSLSESGPFTEIASTTGTDYKDEGLSNGTTYYYFVRSTDTGGLQSGDSVIVSATPEADTTPPGAPSGLVADGGFGRAYLRWDANTEPDLNGYRVSRAPDAGGPFVEIASGVTEAAYTDMGLTNGTEYFYQIRAEDVAGNLSTEASASCTPDELQDVATGLVGYWPLDATEGTELTDATDQANHGYVFSGTPDWQSGKFGNALHFEESEQESVRIASLPAYRDSGTYTIAFWVRQQDGYINTIFWTNNIWLHNFKLGPFGNPWSSTQAGFENDDSWHHVAIAFDGSDAVSGKRFFVDGVLLSAQPAYATDSSLSDTVMQFSYNHSAYRWGGVIDDIAVWNRALSIDEVESLAISNGGDGRPVSEGLLPTFASWIGDHSIPGPTGFGDDGDGDGLANGIEYFLGLHPGQADPAAFRMAHNGPDLVLEHPNPPEPTADVVATYQWSTDLLSFHDSGEFADGVTVTLTPERDTPVPGTTRVGISRIGDPAKLFFRIQVEEVE